MLNKIIPQRFKMLEEEPADAVCRRAKLPCVPEHALAATFPLMCSYPMKPVGGE